MQSARAGVSKRASVCVLCCVVWWNARGRCVGVIFLLRISAVICLRWRACSGQRIQSVVSSILRDRSENTTHATASQHITIAGWLLLPGTQTGYLHCMMACFRVQHMVIERLCACVRLPCKRTRARVQTQCAIISGGIAVRHTAGCYANISARKQNACVQFRETGAHVYKRSRNLRVCAC